MKPAVCSIPAGSFSSNLIATSRKQPAHVNWRGGAFREVSDGLEEEEEEEEEEGGMTHL